ncbi:MAG TPA: DUF4340 domain-containing protein, partial [Candidatus Hydrogenedentes bacterium]|nr:DUF4340 domain-containing protein [Candidatus Hydrogenedentota bacterium]
VVLKQMNKPVYEITQQVKLDALVPEGLATADIAKLELYAGGKPDAKLIITRDPADATAWWVTSHFNAPANTEKVEEFIKKAVGLRGERRDSNAGDATLAAYSLKDDTAFHVKGYKKDDATAAFSVLVGKAPAPDQVFMRAADSTTVYLLADNLKSDAGIFQDDAAAEVKADGWLKKEVVNIAKDTISKVSVTTPDKRLSIAKQTKEVPVDAAEPASDTAPKEGEAEAAKPATKTEVTWALSEGGTGLTVKQSGVENLAGAFAPLTASDIVDPAKLADWGLETPQFTCTITVDGKEGDVVIEGGRPDPNGDGYVRVASANKAIIYKLSKFTFEKIFPKGTDMFTLAGLTLDKAQIAKIDLVQPAGSISASKAGEEWVIASPTADLAPQTSALDAVANVLSAWTPSDYADSADAASLDAPTHTAVVTLTSGAQHTLALGAASKGIAGQYARLDNGASVLVMSKGDIDRAFPAPKDIYQRQLFDFIEDDINSVTVQRDAGSFQIARTDTGWSLTIDGATAPANVQACDMLATALVDFEASDILFGQPDITVAPVATVTVTLKDGTTHVLRVGPDENGSSAFAVSGRAQAFRAEKLVVDELLVDGASLRLPEAAAPAEAAMKDQGPSAPPAAPEAAPTAPETPAPAAAPAEAAPMPAASAPEAAPAPDAAPAGIGADAAG